MISFSHDVLESSAAPHHRTLSRVRLPKQENSDGKGTNFFRTDKIIGGKIAFLRNFPAVRGYIIIRCRL